MTNSWKDHVNQAANDRNHGKGETLSIYPNVKDNL